jgi:outer membrane protein
VEGLRKWIGLTFVVSLFAPALFAQNAEPVPLRLTLKDAVDLGLKQTIDLQIANINTAMSQQQQRISRSALLPQATLEATEQIQRYNLQALIGLQIAGVPKNIGPFSGCAAGSSFLRTRLRSESVAKLPG